MTNEQLRQNAAAMLAHTDGKPIQFLHSAYGWTDTDDMEGIGSGIEYRPKPQPITRPWSKPEDVPGPVCWMRHNRTDGGCMLVIGIEPKLGIEALVWKSKVEILTWAEISGWEYSTDRRTWRKCEVVVEAEEIIACRQCGTAMEAGIAIPPAMTDHGYAPLTRVWKCPQCGHSFTQRPSVP